MNEADRLRELQRGTTTARALDYFDARDAVGVAEMLGGWRGSGLPTGHPLDGLLERFGWHGKRFESAEAAHPLVFAAADGSRYGVNPALLPVRSIVRHPWLARAPYAPRLFLRLGPALRTTRPRARLRMTEYRGVVSATMVYDDLPILDVFRRVDGDTVVGVMDLRGSRRPFCFVLRREGDVNGAGGTRSARD